MVYLLQRMLQQASSLTNAAHCICQTYEDFLLLLLSATAQTMEKFAKQFDQHQNKFKMKDNHHN